MKIIHIVQFLGIGGLEKVLLTLIQEQIKQGHQVELIVYDYERSWVDYFRKKNIKVFTDYTKKNGIDFNLVKYLYKKTINADIVHGHDLNPMIYLGLMKLIYFPFKKSNPKLIQTTHGMEHIQASTKNKLYEYLFSKMIDKLITVSPTFKKWYLAHGVSSKKVYHIDNGVEIETRSFKNKLNLRRELSLPPEHKILICVGRVVPMKGQDFLITQHQNIKNASLVIIGPYDNKEYYHKLKNLNLKHVYFLGKKSNIMDYLYEADIFVSASKHEGHPISVLEAGTVPLPCLLSDIPGHTDLERDSKDKLFESFKIGDSKDYVAKLNALIKNDEKSKILAHKLFQKVQQHYSATQMAEKIEKIYQDKYD
ncbi:MAG: glycosyltransferase family 4 protein [Bacteriovoracaceae bacterium]|jgi:glycosyltransferase involved in cell wall biosynthesis|nr:hypothetical protein [Halobacteriovoraceae bacterium]MDP7319970.1 glycosyltransferase family 4 protein [Bacteriovoracaceae bacterium]|tara:strand:- start:270 stop:1367 length:1098 start_codon:yes stop_codon:yes gene_type:complete